MYDVNGEWRRLSMVIPIAIGSEWSNFEEFYSLLSIHHSQKAE